MVVLTRMAAIGHIGRIARFWIVQKKESSKFSDRLEIKHERKCGRQIKVPSEGFGSEQLGNGVSLGGKMRSV